MTRQGKQVQFTKGRKLLLNFQTNFLLFPEVKFTSSIFNASNPRNSDWLIGMLSPRAKHSGKNEQKDADQIPVRVRKRREGILMKNENVTISVG